MDLSRQKVYISDGLEYTFLNTFNIDLAITGGILFIIFLVFIIYFAFIMHRRNKKPDPSLREITRHEISYDDEEGIN